MHDELGRQFAALPPEEQLAELIPMMRDEIARRDQFAALVADQDLATDDPHRMLLVATNESVMRLGERIVALGGTPPAVD